jgi:hypothetical protein
MALVVTLTKDGNDVWGRTRVQHASLALDNSYPTGGYSLPATKFGMRALFNMLIGDMGISGVGAYRFAWDSVNSKLMAYRTAGFTPAGSGTAAAQTFTGTAAKVVNNTPVFTGTGLTAAGQVLTSTDNQTMTLNQCAGMILISATGNVVEIVSNTAVTGAPAVLTVVGKATTDAGVYSIFTGPTPAGTNGTSAVTFTGTAIAAGALVQVANAVDLSAITALYVTALGR